jgi:hypothetical protein
MDERRRGLQVILAEDVRCSAAGIRIPPGGILLRLRYVQGR